jgi:hypothetical protein
LSKLTLGPAVVGLILAASQAQASLIFVGPIASSGNGIGAVNTSLTFQNAGSESGCVAYNGTASFTGAGACPPTGGFIGGDEGNGASQTNVFTAAQLGFSATRNFSNLLVIFNGNEGGGPGGAITLNSLGLSLYSASGIHLQTFTTTGPNTFTAFPGVGNAGFGFALDEAQAAQANAILAAIPLLRVGTSANASDANAGPETIQLTTVANTGIGGGGGTGGGTGGQIPEPSSFILLSLGAAFLGGPSLFNRLRRG